MAEFINTIDTLGDTVAMNRVIDGSITEFNDDVLTTVGKHAFYNCSQLRRVDLTSATSILDTAFRGCSLLTTIVLRNTNRICPLSGYSHFANTLIASGKGRIYVPRALVDSYKTSSSWSTYKDMIYAIEDYSSDGTVMGEIETYEPISFVSSSWNKIAEVANAGEAQTHFKVGDTRTITVGEKSIDLVIIGFNHDDLADGSGKAHMTMLCKTAPDDTFTTDGGWATLSSSMESILLPKLPTDLQPHIKAVTKQCDTWEQNVEQTPVNVDFKLFPLSLDEMKIYSFGVKRYTDSDWRTQLTELGTPYQFFIDNYSKSYYGSFYGALGATSPQAWIRQYYRNPYNMTTLRGQPSLLMSTQNLYTYTESTLATNAYPVQLAFCI